MLIFRMLVSSSILLFLIVDTAWSAVDCIAQGTDVSSTTSSLQGKRVVASQGADQWNEEHCSSNGDLIEIARGTGDPIDPTRQVGTWSGEDAGATVTYTYTENASAFTFTVRAETVSPDVGDEIVFCDGNAEVARGTIQASAGVCP